MSKTAEKDDPQLWDQVKSEVTESDKGGRRGQWSARKAQLATQEYQKRGGGYVGEKDEDNSLKEWTEEEWGTKSGKRSLETGERYLPKEEREKLSDEEYRRTTEKKRKDTRRGKQFSGQPEDIRAKTSSARGKRGDGEPTKEELYAEAQERGIPGRSKMNKQQLIEALNDE